MILGQEVKGGPMLDVAGRMMVLPFQPLAMTFQDISYCVDTPPVIYVLPSKMNEFIDNPGTHNSCDSLHFARK